MSILNLHDRRAIEALVVRLDTKAIGQSLDDGGLSRLAREVVVEALARRILADEIGPGARADDRVWQVFDRALGVCVTLSYLLPLALMFGLAW